MGLLALVLAVILFYTKSMETLRLLCKQVLLVGLLMGCAVVLPAQQGVLLPEEQTPTVIDNSFDLDTFLRRSNETFKVNWQNLRRPEIPADTQDPLLQSIRDAALRKVQPEPVKPWQIFIFEGSEESYEQQKSMQVRIRKELLDRSIMRAIVISEPLLRKAPNEKNYTFPLYIYSLQNGKVKEEKVQLSRSLGRTGILDALFRFAKEVEDADFYTGVIINVHGFEDAMVFNNREGYFDTFFGVDDILYNAKEYGIFIDVLDLISCHVGSLSQMLPLIRSDVVRYVLVSSNLSVQKRDFPPALLGNLTYGPKEAVRRSLQQEEITLSPAKNPTILLTRGVDSFNLVLLEPRKLREYMRDWIEQVYRIREYLTFEESYLKTKKGEATHVSLYHFMKKLETMVEQNAEIPPEMKRDFLYANARLKLKIHPLNVPQWCYSHPQNKFYDIAFYAKEVPPEESGCLHTMSVMPLRIAKPKEYPAYYWPGITPFSR